MTPDPKELKVFRYVSQSLDDTFEPPMYLNYKSGLNRRLHAERIKVRGEIQTVNYWATATPSATGVDYSDLVIKEEISYQRNPLGFAQTQTKVITWYCEDDSAHPTTKELFKVYAPIESIFEGERRRRNIISELKIKCVGLLQATERTASSELVMGWGREFLAEHAGAIALFIEGSDPKVYRDIQADERAWLNNRVDTNGTTIRDLILDTLNVWGL